MRLDRNKSTSRATTDPNGMSINAVG